MSLQKRINKKLDKAFKELDLSVADLSKMTGLNRGTIYRVGYGTYNFRLDTLEKALASLGKRIRFKIVDKEDA